MRAGASRAPRLDRATTACQSPFHAHRRERMSRHGRTARACAGERRRPPCPGARGGRGWRAAAPAAATRRLGGDPARPRGARRGRLLGNAGTRHRPRDPASDARAGPRYPAPAAHADGPLARAALPAARPALVRPLRPEWAAEPHGGERPLPGRAHGARARDLGPLWPPTPPPTTCSRIRPPPCLARCGGEARRGAGPTISGAASACAWRSSTWTRCGRASPP